MPSVVITVAGDDSDSNSNSSSDCYFEFDFHFDFNFDGVDGLEQIVEGDER